MSEPPEMGAGRALGMGAREAIGAPALVLGASYLGFGSLVRASDMSMMEGLVSTATTFALPGQIAMVELYAIGGSAAVVTLAVALTNVRLLPMTLVLTPILHDRRWPRWLDYAAAHWIAVTGWVRAMQRCPELARVDRLPYFLGFCAVLWSTTLVATAIGFGLADRVPAYVTLGLVFVNPVYFMIVMTADLRDRGRVYAFVLGALAGPPAFLASPDWGLLATGLVAGTGAFLADRWMRARGR